MSWIIQEEQVRRNGIRTMVRYGNGKVYAVDTANTFDCGPETMIFRCYGKQELINWNELFTKRYETMEEAVKTHREISKDPEAYLPPGKR